MNNETNELSAEERHAFAALAKEKLPPAFLEERIVQQLKAAGIIHSARTSWLPGYPKLAAGLAFSIALFVIGALAGARWFSMAMQPDLPGFILIVRTSSPESEAKTPAEELVRVKEYTAWAQDLGRKGMLLGGEKLKGDGRLLSSALGSNTISETPAKPVEGSIAGYFLLPATDYDQAVAISRTCPHLRYGGTVELRQIERF